jgi:hypothetical protein
MSSISLADYHRHPAWSPTTHPEPVKGNILLKPTVHRFSSRAAVGAVKSQQVKATRFPTHRPSISSLS